MSNGIYRNFTAARVMTHLNRRASEVYAKWNATILEKLRDNVARSVTVT
jgi:hypothetical protein